VKQGLLAALAVSCAIAAHALDPERALTQARLTIWTTESGLPQNTVDAIAQTRDGYLWMGTEEGLVRFDGVRFVASDRQSAPALRSAFISSLFEAPDGTLWIGTYGGGMARLRNGRIEPFHAEQLANDRMREMLATPEGVFVATAGGGLLRIAGDRVTRYTTRDGLPTDRIWTLEPDGAGGLWVATHGGGVVRWRNGRVQQRISTREGLPNDFARALLRDRDGTLWIGTDGGGVVMWRDGAIARTITTRDGLPSDLIRALLRDRDGSLWIATDAGLARWRGERAETLGVAEGLPSAVVRTILEDREGSLWVGTTGGLVRLRDTRFQSFKRKEGLPVDAVRALLEDRDGRVWIGTEGGGLCVLEGGRMQCHTKETGLQHDTVYALAAHRDRGVWAGTDGGGVALFRDGIKLATVDVRSGLPNNRVRALLDGPGGLWVSTTGGLVLMRERPVHVRELHDRQIRPLLALPDGTVLAGTDGAGLWRVTADGASATLIASTKNGLHSDRVFSLALDSGGNGVWIGTSGGGLARLDLATGGVRSLLRRDGLHDDVVFQVVDAGDELWLTSNRGLYRIERRRVLDAMQQRKTDLSGTVFGAADGMPSTECNAGFPSAIRTRDGRLWVGTARGVAVIDPSIDRRNTIAPPVHVEEILVDGIAAPPGPVRIESGSHRLEVRYTALALRSPEHVTFRYKLDGYDRDWVDAGTNRIAHYTRLAPGEYRFRVVATNEDDVGSNGDASLAVFVEPRWFETWWARLAAIALLAALVWGVMRLRFAAKLEDINRQLALANERLRGLSYIDGLTGVANRRRFDEALAEACDAAGKAGAPVSLVLLDLDHFKQLNDSQGHQHGDEALRAIAALLIERTQTRGGLVARVGGEEFAWLLPGVPLDAAMADAETLRIKVRDGGLVTASLGVSSAIGRRASADALVAAADAALYRAKSGGRDRVATA
jgi:diguanylate cyclase (GGDEF)-like protein